MFGVHDHTNNQMLTHGYKRKTSKQFLDFIKRVDRKYDDNGVKQIFLVLDNASIHKSKIVKETLARYHPRIHLVFLPTESSRAKSDRGKVAVDAQTGYKQLRLQ